MEYKGIYFTQGNSKLPQNTAILNMNPATECPSKKRGLCPVAERCYAMKAERQYPDCKPFRNKQATQWNNIPAIDIAEAIILKSKRARKHKIKYLRFSEAGDFKTQNDINKMIKLAEILYKKAGIKTYGYTARKDLDFGGMLNKEYITVNGSGFMLDNKFTPVPPEHTEGMDNICCGDCSICDMCKYDNNLDIKVAIH